MEQLKKARQIGDQSGTAGSNSPTKKTVAGTLHGTNAGTSN